MSPAGSLEPFLLEHVSVPRQYELKKAILKALAPVGAFCFLVQVGTRVGYGFHRNPHFRFYWELPDQGFIGPNTMADGCRTENLNRRLKGNANMAKTLATHVGRDKTINPKWNGYLGRTDFRKRPL